MISCIGELVHFSVVSLAATRRTSYKDFGLLETVDFIELLSQVLDGLLDSIFASPDKLKSDGLSPLLSLYSRFLPGIFTFAAAFFVFLGLSLSVLTENLRR